MVTVNISENDLVKLLKKFSIFERNKIPLETSFLRQPCIFSLQVLEEVLRMCEVEEIVLDKGPGAGMLCSV